MEIGAIKIKDGFFVGDVYAAKVHPAPTQDIEFVILNKITRILNCAAAEVPNIFAGDSVLYMPFDWAEGSEHVQLTTSCRNT